jgi:antitoxin (DNA-binding transcriptional repressor) of toxin-antitoxin stability system
MTLVANVVPRDHIPRMKTIGVRELKTHLSRVLRDVAAGDVVLVTDRGRVVAELRQPGQESTGGSAEHRALAKLAALGHLRIAERSVNHYPASPLKSRKGTARSVLDADRDE